MINSFLQKLSTWVTVKSNTSTWIAFILPKSVSFLRTMKMCSAFTPDCGYDNSTIILIGDVYCPNTNCSGKLCLHKNTFQSLSKSDYQCLQWASVCQVRNFFWRSDDFLFLVAWSRGLRFWREPKINSRCFWRFGLSWYVMFQQREMRVSWRLCNNTEIHLWCWEVWRLVLCS